MEIIITVLIVGALVGLYFGGRAIGDGANPPTITLPRESSAADCKQACTEWDNARQMQCNAKADEEAARNRADGIRNELLAVLAAAVALAVSGAATLAAAAAATATIFGIPAGIVLTGIGIGLLIAAAAAFALADVLMGELGSAESDVANKAAARNAWDKAVADARNKVNSKCTLDEANSCLGRAAPC